MSLHDKKIFKELDTYELLELTNNYIDDNNYNFDGKLYLFEDYLKNNNRYSGEFYQKDVIKWFEMVIGDKDILNDYYQYRYL